ncbi:Erythronate-4-phosphate dehydrogenase [Moellerella wisconsensis]|nr:Erythronate-4-phosphate dehydrogenase [Moellerella wisconsensis]
MYPNSHRIAAVKILVDENMPYAEVLFSRLGEVKAIPGRPIPVAELRHADALMVRSITKVDPALLAGTPVKFVGTATAGFDHVDIDGLTQAGIGFSSAPGCNAIAVVEYVFSALMMLAQRDNFDLRDKTVGIIGVGNVGGRLAARLKAWGVKTLLCDPPRHDKGDKEDFLPFEQLLAEADVLTFHTPLNKSGEYRSYHLLNEPALEKLPDETIIINASRGEVVDNQALLKQLKAGRKFSVILDVWEPEPNLSIELMALVDIATPHIAGYSLEGKARGTTQVFEAYSQFLGLSHQVELSDLLPVPEFDTVTLRGELTQDRLKRLIHLVYDVRRDDAPLRKVAAMAGEFDKLRKNYPERREWSSLCVACDNRETLAQLTALGFTTQLI